MVQYHPDILSWLGKNELGKIVRAKSVGGGCIHQSLVLQTDTGNQFFLKQNNRIPPDMFSSEAKGLHALRIPNGPRVPEVFLVGETYLLLEDLQPSARCEDFWVIYGRQMANIHSLTNERFGFDSNNYIGSNPQFNPWTKDGHDFFLRHRLRPQIDLAKKQNLISYQEFQLLDRLMKKVKDLVPDQPPSLLHGDLWSGNLITDGHGKPAIIDPAAYFGWAEADLAMTDLFGSYPEEFYSAYREIRPLETGYRSRFPLYNLYHLLNHLNMFGLSYLNGIREILSRYLA